MPAILITAPDLSQNHPNGKPGINNTMIAEAVMAALKLDDYWITGGKGAIILANIVFGLLGLLLLIALFAYIITLRHNQKQRSGKPEAYQRRADVGRPENNSQCNTAGRNEVVQLPKVDKVDDAGSERSFVSAQQFQSCV
ncbi:hypothetical protein PG993_005770 [Apiospora rasikravindrae]|uniref:Uncharacterized protein n=1 Tax=Apiospora rasikravindrae TaxID=990691 RepID=A0ABR1TBJ1_9PEZI